MLWGSNDGQDWDAEHNLITEPLIQQETRADHLALLRVWLFQVDLASNKPELDTYQQKKITAAMATGASLLCELPTENSMSYDEHMVTLFKGECNYYEFMNEPDDEGISVATYVSDWTTEIPRLRAIDPHAKFGGPASASPQYTDCTYSFGPTVCYMQKVLQGMAQHKVLPDFVTFHQYACYQEAQEKCLASTGIYAADVAMVKGWLTQYFGTAGTSIPVGITEWNVDPSAPMPNYTSNPCWMEKFTSASLASMAQAGVSFATQYDLANASGYGTDDMFDVGNQGKAKPQYYAMLQVISRISPYGTLPMPQLDYTQPAHCPTATATS